MARPRKTGLGKGLDALFEDNHVEEHGVTMLKLSSVEPNSNQPRSDFDEAALMELADSIRTHGVLQPLVVRPMQSGIYQIVAGERRWRASRMAGLTEIPVVIKELSDSETLEIAIIENLQREDLNPIELAIGYKTLMEEYGFTQEQVAEKVGKSRPVVANTVRLLALPDEVLVYIREGKLTTGHARALLGLEDDDIIAVAARKAIDKGLLVRDIEKMARDHKNGDKPQTTGSKGKSSRPNSGWGHSYYKEMELALANELGRKVSIVEQGEKATLSLEFYSEKELKEFVDIIMSSENKNMKGE